MNKFLKLACIAGIALTATSQSAFAAPFGRPRTPTAEDTIIVKGMAVANLDYIVANSAAFKTGNDQRQVTFKTQIDAANQRRQQLIAQLQPLVDKYNRDRAAPSADQAALRQQAEQINRNQTAGNQQINQLLEPVRASETYVKEQIEDKLAAAIQSAMIKNWISILFKPQVVQAMNGAYNLNPAIIAELNALLPSAQLMPPAGWQPRAVRQAQAAQQGQNPSQ